MQRHYKKILIERTGDSRVESRTLRLDSYIESVQGLFTVIDYPPVVYDGPRIGIKYDGYEILPDDFDALLMSYQGLLPMSDVMLPTPYNRQGTDGVTIDITVTFPETEYDRQRRTGKTPTVSRAPQQLLLYVVSNSK